VGARAVFGVSFGVATAVLYLACTGKHDPTPPNSTDDGDGGAAVSSTTGFVSDGAAICGNEEHTPLTTYPLLYFVFDRSGSMADVEGGQTRYEQVRSAALDMTDSLGALVRVGAAVFPTDDPNGVDACIPGKEVYSPKVDPGPVFASSIDVEPFGGTPISATLEALLPELSAETAPKVVLLATDGAPNCNGDITCGPDQCMVNLLGQCPPDVPNCCEPPDGTWLNCVDRLATIQAVMALKNAGVNVYVIGIPGSELFATVLDQMALAGGVPQEGQPTYYYRVDDLATLSGVFKGIASALVSCTYDVADPPTEQGLTNVYFDEVVVPLDPVDGWVWVDGDTIELEGAACQQLKNGGVHKVQIVSGCPTVTPL
jgi:hypothetical protein